MPNKTIYVSDSDLPLFQRAQELTGGNLSAAITQALRRLVDTEEARQAGFAEVTVTVGTGTSRRQQRFNGAPLGEWSRSDRDHVETFRVWLSRQGRFVLYTETSEQWVHTAGPDGQVTGWRKHFVADQQWGQIPASATLEVFETLDELEPRLPTELFAIVSANADLPEVEDLDI
jgi:EXLDI family protein